jgi:cellulose synthase/poly-beta-1,6-N-acetylglucosamine synthase-like glycosyltransferase
MTAAPRVMVVMPAYNAARTLERTYRDIPNNIVDKIILVDDVSQDETVEIAPLHKVISRYHRASLFGKTE